MDTFIGTGINPRGEDLPLGFGMQLAQEPEAVAAFGRLSQEDRDRVVRFIQSSQTGDEAQNRIAEAVASLKDNNLAPFGL